MARSRDLLERFRLAGTPGAAARPGVPADRVEELSAELEPVLERLADAVDRAQRIRRDADVEADRVRDEAQERARTMLAQAQQDAAAERADVARRVQEQAERDANDVGRAAEVEAAAVWESAEPLLQESVDRVVARLRASVAAAGRPATGADDT